MTYVLYEHLFNSRGEWIAFKVENNVFGTDGQWIGWVVSEDGDVATPEGDYLGTICSGGRFYSFRSREGRHTFGAGQYPGYPGLPDRPESVGFSALPDDADDIEELS